MGVENQRGFPYSSDKQRNHIGRHLPFFKRTFNDPYVSKE